MTKFDAVVEDVLLEAREDYVGLWSIVQQIRDRGLAGDVEIRDAALDVIRRLLSEHDVIAGSFGPPRFPDITASATFSKHGFHVWSIPTEKILQEISREWQALGRDPIIGEIIWFTLVPPVK